MCVYVLCMCVLCTLVDVWCVVCIIWMGGVGRQCMCIGLVNIVLLYMGFVFCRRVYMSWCCEDE